jgi:multidrug resistance efflux pump
MNQSQLTGKKHHKGKIAAAVLVAAALACGGFFAWKHFHPAEIADDGGAPQPESVVRTDIEDLYNASGIVISSNSVSLKAGAGDDETYPIKDVMVKVGDKVKKGDVLYTLDLNALTKDIDKQKQKMADDGQGNAIDLGAADRAVANAQADAEQTADDAAREMRRAEEDTNRALSHQADAQQKINEYAVEEQNAQAVYADACNTFSEIDFKYKQLQTAVSDAQSAKAAAEHEEQKIEIEEGMEKPEDPVVEKPKEPATSDPDYDVKLEEYQAQQAAYDHYMKIDKPQYEKDKEKYDAYLAKVKSAKKKVEDTSYALTQAQAELDGYEKAHSEAETAMTNAKADMEKARSEREAAEEALKQTEDEVTQGVRKQEDQAAAAEKESRASRESEAQARDSQAKQKLEVEKNLRDLTEELKKSQQKLENGTVYAAADGTITGVNIKAGQPYTGNNPVEINNLKHLKVTANIEEGHISDLYVGMPVRIKTDATKDREIEGIVSYTSLTPISSKTDADPSQVQDTGTNTSSKAKYRVDIDLAGDSSRLRIGMNAKIDFVIASEKNCLAVPTSCITTDPDGSSYVIVSGSGDIGSDASSMAEGPAESGAEAMIGGQIPVEIGISDDYYTQIVSGDLKEGDLVEVVSDQEGMDGGEGGQLSGIYG